MAHPDPRHIMFGHAFKGQHSGKALLQRFQAGGGTLYDLEYLTDATGRRVAAFGYWAGYAGAAVSVIAWLAQQGAKHADPFPHIRTKTPCCATYMTRCRVFPHPQMPL